MAIRISKWSFVAALALGMGYGMWAVFSHKVRASLGYVVEARFEKMPPNDKSLIEWLQSQPGVIPDHVAVGRFEGGKLLYVSFMMTRSLAGLPPFPDLNGQVLRLGYTGQDGSFRDSFASLAITMD